MAVRVENDVEQRRYDAAGAGLVYSIVCVRVNYSFWKTGTPFNYSDDSGDDDDDRAPDDIQTSDPDDEENGYNDGVINDEIHNGLLRRMQLP